MFTNVMHENSISPVRRLPYCPHLALFLAMVSTTAACGESAQVADGAGTLRVILEPEDTILNGLTPGDGVENIRDGWTVSYDKYIVALGRVAVDYATDRDMTEEDERSFVVDLTSVPPNGVALWKIEGLRPGRWNFGYELTGGAHGAKPHESVEESDYDRVVDEDLTYLISGKLSKENGVSCPPPKYVEGVTLEPSGEDEAGNPCYPNPVVGFEFAVAAETSVTNCQLDGVAGFAIADGTTSTEAITLHGDHPFFNGFPSGSEGGITRLAQLWADADSNADGALDVAELDGQMLADLAQWDERYQLGGAPKVGDLSTLKDILIAQLKTQGHMNGEGECEVDGQAHSHEDE